MASKEQIRLANIIKGVHEDLRQSAKESGPSTAWTEHLQKKDLLKTYSEAMHSLANIWENNAQCGDSGAQSRIDWIKDYCSTYFLREDLLCERRRKERKALEMANPNHQQTEERELGKIEKIRLLDVGSCFNPFSGLDQFEVTAIDISPAVDSVYQCDFLQVDLSNSSELDISRNGITCLPRNYFHCIVFSLLLEYLPTSEQRVQACSMAYELLKYEGILIIITPDSQHVGKNAKLMKNWRYTLAELGFSRIKFEKLPHITCMVFRKSLDKFITMEWASKHKEDYMSLSIHTPQDDLRR